MKKMLLFLKLICILLLLQSSLVSQVRSGTTAAKNKAIITKMYHYFNLNNWDSLAAIIAPDFVSHTPHPGQKPGFEGMKEGFGEFRKAFPGVVNTPLDIVADGDLVIVRGNVKGTQTGAMNGVPASGKTMDIEYFDEWRLRDGTVKELWGLSDVTKMMNQLGLIPAQSDSASQK